MAYHTQVITVTASRQQVIVPNGTAHNRIDFGVQVPTGAAASVFWGGPDVVASGGAGTARGWEIPAGQSFSDDLIGKEGAPYLVSGGGSIDVVVMYSD